MNLTDPELKSRLETIKSGFGKQVCVVASGADKDTASCKDWLAQSQKAGTLAHAPHHATETPPNSRRPIVAMPRVSFALPRARA